MPFKNDDMIVLLSPAKTLDYEKPDTEIDKTLPRMMTDSNRLLRILKKKSRDEISKLMHISDKLADLNVRRYKNFRRDFTDENSKTAILAFKGDVYLGLDAETLSVEELEYANGNIRILSGLYGLLRPLDRMQPYRLEMGTKLENKNGTNLYHYWGDSITKLLNKDLKDKESSLVVNLASNEYFKVINRKRVKADIIDVDFKEEKNGELKFVSFFAKKARGLMARYIIDQKITTPEDLKGFDYEGYRFHEETPEKNKLLFVR